MRHQKVSHLREYALHGIAAQVEVLAAATTGGVDQINMIHRLIRTPGNALQALRVTNHVRQKARMHAGEAIQLAQGCIRIWLEICGIIHESGVAGKGVRQDNDGGDRDRLPALVLIHDMANQIGYIDHHTGTGAASHRADDEDKTLPFLNVRCIKI